MRVEQIPVAYRYHCDSCKATHLQSNASGHYTESTPPGWVSFRVVAMTTEGHTQRDEKVLICDVCVAQTKKALFNKYHDKLLVTIFGQPEPEEKS